MVRVCVPFYINVRDWFKNIIIEVWKLNLTLIDFDVHCPSFCNNVHRPSFCNSVYWPNFCNTVHLPSFLILFTGPVL
jgi:hypothetical protein